MNEKRAFMSLEFSILIIIAELYLRIIILFLAKDEIFHKIIVLLKLNMKTAIHLKAQAKGFSLFELLTVVAILGIISSLAIAWFGGTGQDVRQARDQQNAQTICTLCRAAEAAGLDLATETTTSFEIARRFAEGVTVEQGVLKGQTFRVSIGIEESKAAAQYLLIRDGELVYDMSGRAKPGETNANGEI